MDVRQYARQPSSAMKAQDSFLGLPKRGLVLILANLLFWQPLLANADGIVVSGPGTTVGQAGNGVPVVNIATPNGSGLSHNQFKDYNVGPNGVILNNANSALQSTQLGGIIVGNPNLRGGAANVILNEVNGGSPSQLRGYTEVAGQSAKVIVANPYGISCSGCGFINTPNVTLTTGKPIINDGRVDRYQVDGGAVTIDGKGLNASNVDRFEIITRSAKINAQINARQLTVIAGRNDVDAQTLKATARADDGSAKPELAIDSSALGGMYAGAIKLVGTEAGVGVKLDGTLAASGGDIQLDANGHLSMAQAAASGAVDVKAASLDAQGPVYAGTTLKLNTTGELKNRKSLAARDTVTLASNGQLTNNGIIEAGVNDDNTRNKTGDVSLESQNITNTGNVIASRNVTAKATQTLNNQGGGLSARQALKVTAGTLDNQNNGRVLSGNTLDITSTHVDNRHKGVISSTGAQTLNVSELLDNSQDGSIDSGAALDLHGKTLDNSAGNLTSTGALTVDLLGDLINRSGRLASAGPVLIQRAGHLDNQGGKLTSQTLLTLFANSLDNRNQGTVAGNDVLNINATGLLQNSGGGLVHSENAGLTITAGTLENGGGRIAAKAGDAVITAQDFNNGDGNLFARNRIRLNGGNVDNGGQIAGEQIDLSLSGALNNRGLIESATILDVATASVSNSGQLRALGTTGKTRFAIGGLLDNHGGTLEAANTNLTLGAGSFQNQGGSVLHVGNGVFDIAGLNLDNVGGSFVTHGDLTLDKAAWTNNSVIQAGRLTVNVGNLTQTSTGRLLGTSSLVGKGQDWLVQGTLASPGSVDLVVDNLVNDHGLIFSGANMGLQVNTLKNLDATVYSMGDLRIDRDGQGGLASSIINSSATVQSDGALSLAASTIQNIRTLLTTESGIYSASITPTACIFNVTGGDCDGGKENWPFLISQRERLIVTGASAASSITSGGSMLLTGGELLNSSSSIAAGGNLTARVTQLTNVGVVTHDTLSERIFASERDRNQGIWSRPAAEFTERYSQGGAKYNPKDLGGLEAAMAAFIGTMEKEWVPVKTTELAPSDQRYSAVIQAGGVVDIKAQAGIDNNVVRGGYTYVGSGANTHVPGYSTQVSLNPQLPPDIAQQQVNPLGLPGFDLPTGQNGLFHLNDGSGVKGLPNSQFATNPQKYLIETNPLLTDMRQFMSSDYMLSKLGYDPDTAQRRLGDGFYEQRLIQQAVIARTGQRFIDGQTSDAGVFKYLMDNAVSSKQALNLAVGVSLTAEQVAALTHDIVWLENATVAGEKVLVPVLYLAQASNRLAPNGALISGSDLNLMAGADLNNVGTLRATNNLLASAGNLSNSGLMEAGNRLDLLTSNNLSNRAGGIIAGRDVELSAGGDLLNARSVTTHESASDYRVERTDFIDSAARIESAGSLLLNAGGDINNVGGALKSGGDTTVQAVRDVNLVSAQTLSNGAIGNTSHVETITQQGSVVDAGRDFHVVAGRDVSAAGSQIEAKRDIGVGATGNLNLVAAANEQHSAFNSKKVKSVEDHVSQVSTVLKAGGDATLSAGQDLQLVGSQVNAANEAYLVAGKNLTLQTAQDQDYSFFSKTKKTSQGKKFRLDETGTVNNVGSLVSAGGNSTLVAGENLLLAGSAITAEKGAARLAAGQDVSILAVSDSDSARHERKESKSSWGGLKSSKVQDKVDENRTTAVGSMVSGDTVTVTAKRDAQVTGSALVSTGDLVVQAGRDLTIDAAQNTFSRTDMHKEKNRDLTGVLTGNKLGLDDLTGNQHLYINSQKHNGTANETTLTGSTVGSSAGNVTLTAGRELSVVASDLVSTQNMALTGSNVSITAGAETARQTSEDSARSLAVGRVIGGAVVDSARTIRDASKAAKNADDPRLKAVKIAQAALAFYNMGGQASDANGQSTGFKDKQGGSPSNGSLIKIGTELANNRSKSSSEYNSQTARQSTLNAGQELAIVATGEAADTLGDIQITGSSMKAGSTSLLAKNDVLLQSAQDTVDRKNDGSNNRTAIGASFNIGEQNGFTLDLGAQGAKNMGNGNSVTQVNTTLDTGSLLLQTGRDATLAGAQVRADTIKASIGRDLNIVSRQDTESSKSKQSSAGFGASICIPPFCYGSTVAGSANIAAAKMNSDYQAVTDQSGLFAGAGGYDINVGKTTNLQGAVIASDASADKNRLNTDRLVVSDIKNTSEIQSQSAGIGVSFSSGGGTSLGGSIPVALKEDDRSHTRSAVSDGTIIVRNPEGANDLVGLNRDTANANQRLDRPDEKAMQERIDLIQGSAQLASGVISTVAKAKSDEAKKLGDQAKAQAAAGSPEAGETLLAASTAYAEAQRWKVGGDKKLMADIASGLIAAGLGGATGGTAVGIVANTTSSDIFNKIGSFADAQKNREGIDSATKAAWAEGGAARILLHALAGAAIGLSSGSAQSGALGAGASAAVMPSIANALKGSGMTEADQNAVASLIAAGVGSAVGSGNGITGAVVAGGTANGVEAFNRQLHLQQEIPVLEKKAEELEKTRGKPESSTRWIDLLMIAAGGAVDAADEVRLNKLVLQSSGNDPQSQHFAEDLSLAKSIVAELAAQKIPLTWSNGSQIVANGDKVYAFGATEKQFNDLTLFNAAGVYGPGAVYSQWRQYGQQQTAEHSNEISQLSSYQPTVESAAERLSHVAGKGLLNVSPELDAAALLMPGAKVAKTVVEALLERMAARKALGGLEAEAVVVAKEGAASVPAWTSTEGIFSGKLPGDYPPAATTFNGKVVEKTWDFSSLLPSSPTGALDLFAASRGKDLTALSNLQVGDLGEDISKTFLRDNKHTDIFSVQNSSGNGIDIVSRTPDGRLAFTEVKTSRTGNIGDLSDRQQNMTMFIEDVLGQAAAGEGRYKNIDILDQQRARLMLREFRKSPESVSGNLIGVDLKGQVLRVSPWAR
ncbi:hemagglutinin repeat-containing protein [Pseudomonas sp. 1912-s]|uniref:hemagglutinin repeat-containing protein n=1 Tax=Pseudomonas sp. 1912-s TaxID=3033802 RepID=UPI0023DF4F71|nr:hemagglutinin repeat-containing protein [Pseudomonas sp. 1912-s]MDF3202380.1 hemagglutinin repeat-containing protein [Pseudomonas sp. 1912-s]